ncbi:MULTISPECIES: hypothetical protein [Kocuria]|jgi:hypothetical protein|uniref:hypothetical protein n=1 Tax=Kocuria TaxID=57493 RepID=UPI00203DE94A|nr:MULTISPECIES: hypothetical protein [Kocuria]MCM3688438.1 hypothetical protein [Kocuria rosea]HST71840.1 hypothetical protein [Kocuria rosea]
MRDRTTPPDTQGPTTTHPGFEAARQAYLRARRELTVAALQELILRVRTRYPGAASVLLICDDVEDGLYLAEITDSSGRSLRPDGPLLEARTCHQVLGNLHGPDLAGVSGVDHDPAAMTFQVTISGRHR